jgi:hypothetical protein
MMFYDEETESAGYTDMITDCIFAASVVAIVTVVAMMVWTFKGAF